MLAAVRVIYGAEKKARSPGGGVIDESNCKDLAVVVANKRSTCVATGLPEGRDHVASVFEILLSQAQVGEVQ